MALLVGLAFDLKPRKSPEDKPYDHFAEHDTKQTISAIERVIEMNGYKTKRIGSAKNLLTRFKNLKCDIVFNIAEGVFGRNRESQVPILLDIAGIPYVGSDALTLSVALDKVIAKKIFEYHNIPTPKYFVCRTVEDIPVSVNIDFPLIVKPRFEGSAKGIDASSVVRDRSSLRKKIKHVIGLYGQDALIEEFVDGWEFTVGVIGDKNPEVFPVVQRHVEIKTRLSSHVLEKAGYDKDKLEYREFLDIEPNLESEIKRLALEAFKGLECRDFARMDFRVMRHGCSGYTIYMLEVNPLPSLAKDDYFGMVAELKGFTYDDIINRVLNSALERYGLN